MNTFEFDTLVFNTFFTNLEGNFPTFARAWNFATGREYVGAQRLFLDHFENYATFNQIQSLNLRVKKGAKAHKTAFLKTYKKAEKKAFKGAKLDKKTGLYTASVLEPKTFNLFKSSDVESATNDLNRIDMKSYDYNDLKLAVFEIVSAEKIKLDKLTECIIYEYLALFSGIALKKEKKEVQALKKECSKRDVSCVRLAIELVEQLFIQAIEMLETKPKAKAKAVKKETKKGAQAVASAKSLEEVIQEHYTGGSAYATLLNTASYNYVINAVNQ